MNSGSVTGLLDEQTPYTVQTVILNRTNGIKFMTGGREALVAYCSPYWNWQLIIIYITILIPRNHRENLQNTIKVNHDELCLFSAHSNVYVVVSNGTRHSRPPKNPPAFV